MSAERFVSNEVFGAAFPLLPDRMDSKEARAMLVAIGLQESRFTHRRQIGGPARGWWQFEQGGVNGVLTHAQTKIPIGSVLDMMVYDHEPATSYNAIADNDILACCYARLLLFTHPKALPLVGNYEYAWAYYTWLWRPGAPHRETWDAFYDEAWALNL